jgi:ribosomal-protein-serine acetyltransferase
MKTELDSGCSISFNSVERLNRCATMGYWLAKSQTGRGLMTAAVRALINAGFQQLELNRIQARIATDNRPSQAVCDRAGLKKEGVSRQAEWLYDHFLDITINSVLRSEWKVMPVQLTLGHCDSRQHDLGTSLDAPESNVLP